MSSDIDMLIQPAEHGDVIALREVLAQSPARTASSTPHWNAPFHAHHHCTADRTSASR
jgi:hypothetical protein